MRNYLLPYFILNSISSYSQDSIKISQRIYSYITVWPDSNTLLYKWYAEQNNGIQITFPSIEMDKRIKIIEYVIIEKNGNAFITQDSIKKNAFWVYPFVSAPSDKQPLIELEFWIKLNKQNIYYPIQKNGKEIFDSSEKVIYKNVKWEALEKSFKYKNGRYLLGTSEFMANKKR